MVDRIAIASYITRHSCPRTTEHYDRARHGVHFLAAHVAGLRRSGFTSVAFPQIRRVWKLAAYRPLRRGSGRPDLPMVVTSLYCRESDAAGFRPQPCPGGDWSRVPQGRYAAATAAHPSG